MFKLRKAPLVLGSIAAVMLIVIIAVFGIGAGTNTDLISKALPSIRGTNLLGNIVDIPESLQGDKTIMLLGFKREHQKEVNNWTSIIEKFIKEDNSIKFYVVAVINKTNFLRRLWINNSMRFATSDTDERRRTLTVYTDQKKFANSLDMQLSQVYMIILDKDKNILHKIEGAPDATKIKELNNILEAKASF